VSSYDALGIILDTDPRKATKTGAAKPLEETERITNAESEPGPAGEETGQ
jgi:hypothetical protein